MKRLNCLQILFAFALLATHLTAGEVWISRGAALSGIGTAADPYVINSASSFDTNIASFPADTHIHLMAGTFQTAAGINVKSGWTIQGDGIDQTFIQASNMASASEAVVVVSSTYQPTNVYIQDLTVDCNLQNLPQKAAMEVAAIQISGDNLHLARVKAINFGSTVNGFEDFVLSLSFASTSYAGTNLTIDGCILTQPSTFANGGYLNGISIFGSCGLSGETDPTPVTAVGPGWVIGAEIKDCKLFGINATGHGISFGGNADTKIHDNMIWGCPNLVATYMENSIYSNLEIANNFFDDVSAGIDSLDSDTLVRLRNNLSIHDNNISTVGGFAIRVDSGSGTSLHNGVLIQNNEVTTPVGSDWTTFGIDVLGATNAVMTGNTVSSTTAYAPLIYMQTVTNVTVRNNGTIDGDTLSIWDDTGLKQGEEESTITYSFIPSSVGWYRLATTGNALTGKAVIAYQASGDYSDVEADFTGNGFLGDNIGTIACTRDLNYGLAISGLRLGTDGWTGSSAPVYFDIYVSTVDGSPVYVKLIMDADTAVYSLAGFLGGCAAPTGLASTPTYVSVLDLAYEGGLQMIGSLIVSNSVIVTPNGQIKSSQLDSAGLTGIATLSPSSGGLMLGNGSAWTATDMSGDATLSSAGHLTVTNIASTAGPLGGYQYITSSTALTGSSARVIQASNVVTITLPASATIGKEFLIQNLNSSGTVTMSGTIVGSTTISAGNAAIAVVRPDGKWQVHSF